MVGNDEIILTEKKLRLAQLSWWFIFLAYSTFSIFSQWHSYERMGNAYFTLDTYLALTLDVFGCLIAVFIFWKRSNNWMAIVTSIAIVVVSSFVNGESAKPFWYFVFNNGWGTLETANQSALELANYFSFPFGILTFAIYAYVVLIFPKGNWLFPKAQWLFIGSLILYIVQYARLADFDITVPFSIIAVIAQFVYYRNTETPIHRQQVKWILVFFGLIVLETASFIAFDALNNTFHLTESFSVFYDVFYWSRPVFYLCFLFAISVSVIRYRLWDIDILVNHTLVYSLLTGSLGLLGIVSTAMLNYFIKSMVGEQSSIWAVIISVLPVAAAFNPLREYLQSFVDQFFKPEEINFSDYFVEFRTDVREMLGVARIAQILARQVKKQLNVEYAMIYLQDESDSLCPVNSPNQEETLALALDELTLSQLVGGQLVIGNDNNSYSLLVPLVVARPRYPDFLGVIILGRRLTGMGYSTQVLDNLKKLGEDAGQAIYLAQLSEQSKQKLIA